MPFRVFGTLVLAVWVAMLVELLTHPSESRAYRIGGLVTGLVGASWTLWALARG